MQYSQGHLVLPDPELRERCAWPLPSDEGGTIKLLFFMKFYLQAQARTWPCLSDTCHVRSTVDPRNRLMLNRFRGFTCPPPTGQAASRRRGVSSKCFKYFYFKAKAESGLDCLKWATFSRR